MAAVRLALAVGESVLGGRFDVVLDGDVLGGCRVLGSVSC